MVGGASGLIFAFVVVVWLAYVVPVVLRRYDEASKNQGLTQTDGRGRVLSRLGRRPLAEGAETAPAAASAAVSEDAKRQAARAAGRPVSRQAARRRRRVLITLLTLVVVTAGAVAATPLALAWVAAPVGLTVAWLVTCRIQVRGELGLGTGSLRLRRSGAASPAKRSSTAADDEATVVLSGQFEDIDPDRPHVMQQVELEADALDEQLQIAVPSISTTGEALWDPLPVTLPTYVTKPRAGRTVRSIDFGQPGTWTSGHIEGENVELPTPRDDDASDTQRAVGH